MYYQLILQQLHFMKISFTENLISALSFAALLNGVLKSAKCQCFQTDHIFCFIGLFRLSIVRKLVVVTKPITKAESMHMTDEYLLPINTNRSLKCLFCSEKGTSFPWLRLPAGWWMKSAYQCEAWIDPDLEESTRWNNWTVLSKLSGATPELFLACSSMKACREELTDHRPACCEKSRVR